MIIWDIILRITFRFPGEDFLEAKLFIVVTFRKHHKPFIYELPLILTSYVFVKSVCMLWRTYSRMT